MVYLKFTYMYALIEITYRFKNQLIQSHRVYHSCLILLTVQAVTLFTFFFDNLWLVFFCVFFSLHPIAALPNLQGWQYNGFPFVGESK